MESKGHPRIRMTFARGRWGLTFGSRCTDSWYGNSIITVNKVTDFLRGIDNLVINIGENNIFLELLLEN